MAPTLSATPAHAISHCLLPGYCDCFKLNIVPESSALSHVCTPSGSRPQSGPKHGFTALRHIRGFCPGLCSGLRRWCHCAQQGMKERPIPFFKPWITLTHKHSKTYGRALPLATAGPFTSGLGELTGMWPHLRRALLCIQYSVPPLLKNSAHWSKYILHAPLQPLEDLDAPLHPLPGNYIDLFARYNTSRNHAHAFPWCGRAWARLHISVAPLSLHVLLLYLPQAWKGGCAGGSWRRMVKASTCQSRTRRPGIP